MDSYEKLKKRCEGVLLPCVTFNELNEAIIIDEGVCPNYGRYFQVTVHQENGWNKAMRYYEKEAVRNVIGA